MMFSPLHQFVDNLLYKIVMNRSLAASDEDAYFLFTISDSAETLLGMEEPSSQCCENFKRRRSSEDNDIDSIFIPNCNIHGPVYLRRNMLLTHKSIRLLKRVAPKAYKKYVKRKLSLDLFGNELNILDLDDKTSGLSLKSAFQLCIKLIKNSKSNLVILGHDFLNQTVYTRTNESIELPLPCPLHNLLCSSFTYLLNSMDSQSLSFKVKTENMISNFKISSTGNVWGDLYKIEVLKPEAIKKCT